MTHGAIDFEEMRGTLLTLDEFRDELAVSEPINERTFPTGSGVTFEVGTGWADVGLTEPTNAYLTTPSGVRWRMTHQAVQEAGSLARIPQQTQPWVATTIFQDWLNWAFRGGLGNRDVKLLVQELDGEEPLALTMTRGTIQPFSNLDLLDAAVGGIHAKYGESAEVLVDYKRWHDLRRTNARLIVPGASRVITGTRVADDTWCVGIQIANSLIGYSHPGTSAEGYLFRWWCTNGCTDTLAGGGKLNRRTISEPEDAYRWARDAVDEILGNLEGSFDAVQALTEVRVGNGDGSPGNVPVAQVLGEFYDHFNIPQAERRRIEAEMVELGGDLTLYDVENAVTRAANAEGTSPRSVESLMRLGGHMIHAGRERCDGTLPGGCHQLLPPELAAMAAQLHGAN